MKNMMIGAALLAILATPLSAQSRNCAPRDTVIERLASKYGESRQSMGLGANNAVIEVFASEASGTWTITVTNVRGVTCLVASGQAFEQMAEVLPIPGQDA